MGCNTSKESVPPEESKESQDQYVEKTEDKMEIRLSDNKSEVIENHVQDPSDSKPASAKTITLHSNGSATVTATRGQNKDGAKQLSEETTNNKEKQDTEGEEKAATKIQAAFRGHTTRKSMKQPTGKVEPSSASTQEPTREELEAEFRLDDEELCHAATKIQASFRGHMTRKQNEKEKKPEDDSSTSQAKAQEEEQDIDLTDPDLNKAAVKIQATFRGHMTRKDEKPEN